MPAFKFIRDAEIKPFSGSIRFIAGGATAVIPCKFKHLSQSAFASWADCERNQVSPAADMAKHLLEVIVSWDGIEDASDNLLPLDLPTLTQVIEQHPGVYAGGVAGYVAARHKAIEGN